jgi:hypothetical protein
VVAVAAATTWWFDRVLTHRVANGSDHAVRLAAILPYVGVDRAYTLARAFGLTALLFAYATLLVGLLRPSGRLSATHRQLGLTTLALVAGHAAVPYASELPPYGGWRTGFIPFAQPVSWGIRAASWQSLGILAFYLLALTGPTYYLVGHRTAAWAMVHRSAVAVYALAVAHAVLLGTDFLVHGPTRIALLAAQIPLLVLIAVRLAPRRADARWRRVRWASAAGAVAGSAGLAALTVLVATGDYAPGVRI